MQNSNNYSGLTEQNQWILACDSICKLPRVAISIVKEDFGGKKFLECSVRIAVHVKKNLRPERAELRH